MTRTAVALAALTAAQEAFDPIADEVRFANAALKRSRSKANTERLAAANAAFDIALAACDAAHEAVALAEEQDATDAEVAANAAQAALEPTFL